jgi:zinc protease
MTQSSVTRHILPNGMTLLLRENHNAPLISWWVLYRVGSRNEPTGKTGISHWVEHMMFKGTEQFPAGTLDQAIDRVGGTWNAQTSFDYTAYYETLPADQIDLALRAEADRMINAQFAPEDVESERTVIISERQGSENYPGFWLGEEVQAAAFRVHGYHHEVIGDMADLHTMTRDDLYGHYKTHYVPGNAIAALVGDFDTDQMIRRLETLFGSIPAAPVPTVFVRPEPAQTGERRVTVQRPGAAQYLSINYRIPGITDPDWIKLYLMDAIFGGPSGFGGGSTGTKTTRLYRALVRTELAASASAGMNQTIDPYLYSIDLTLRDGRTLAEVEAAVLAEVEKLRQGEITQAELDKARKQARALLAYSGATVTSQAYMLAYYEHVTGDALWLEKLEDRLMTVTLDDLHTVARKYLDGSQRTVGWFVPVAPEKAVAHE